MKNIIYFGISDGFNIDNVTYLEKELKFKPKLIVGEFSNIDKKKCIKNSYLIQDGFEAFMNKKKNIQVNIPTKLKKFIKDHEYILKPMCSRFEFQTGNFDDYSIKNYVNNALNYWYSIITEKKINLVFFLDSPHRIYDYIVYLICKFKKIPTIYFRDPNFNGKMVMESDFEKSPSGIAEKSKKLKFYKKNFNKNLKNISNAHFNKFNQHKIYFNLNKITHRLKRNHYVEKNLKLNYLSFYKSYIFDEIHPVTKNPFKILKFKNDFRAAKGYEYVFWLLKSTFKTLILKTFYNFFSTNKLPKKYILFAMSYQPEATSYPDAGKFHDQIDTIIKIAKTIDNNTTILIKEHPMQLNLLGAFNYKNPQIRSIKNYKDLIKNKKIELLSQNFNIIKAIKNAEYTLTINGTIAMQSVMNGTPALTFGHAWYVGCESIYRLKSISEIKKFLNSKKFKKVDKYKVIHYMNCLDIMSVPLSYKKFHRLIYPYSNLSNIIIKKNIKKIVRRDLKHFYNIYV